MHAADRLARLLSRPAAVVQQEVRGGQRDGRADVLGIEAVAQRARRGGRGRRTVGGEDRVGQTLDPRVVRAARAAGMELPEFFSFLVELALETRSRGVRAGA